MPGWGVRTSLCAARSRACGPICHPTLSSPWQKRILTVAALYGAVKKLESGVIPLLASPKGVPVVRMMRHMRKNPIASIAVFLLAGVITASLPTVFTARPGLTAAPAPQTSLAQAQLAAINQYCVACHNDRAKTGGVSFEGITPESIGQHAELFEKAVRKLRGRVMPPPGARQPEAEVIDSLVAWLEDSLDRAASQKHLPDQVVLHRLNRKEYANAVGDLLAVE